MKYGILALITVAGLACSNLEKSNQPGPSSKNTLIVFVDTLRADHVGAYGYKPQTSPFIDKLALEGALFKNAYAPSPWTYPSTASLFTGLYPAAHGAIIPGNIRNESSTKGYVVKLDPNIITMADLATKYGIKTALIACNMYVGFGLQKGFQKYRNGNARGAEKQTDLAIKWLTNLNKDDRFLLVVHFMDVHQPNTNRKIDRQYFKALQNLSAEEQEYSRNWHPEFASPKPEEVEGFEEYRSRRMGMYDASIRYVDSQIERLVEALGERKKDTLIIFLSDHGEEFWDHNELEKSLYYLPPGRLGINHGHTFFEEMVHIPLIMYQPGMIKPHVINERASLLDVLPTVTEFMKISDTSPREGLSLGPVLLKNESIPSRSLLFDAVCYGHDKQGLLSENLKFVRSWYEPPCLLDLSTDPKEKNNLANERPSDTKTNSEMLENLFNASKALGNSLRKGKPPETRQLEEQELKALQALGYFEDYDAEL